MKCAGNLLSNHCFKLSPIQLIGRSFLGNKETIWFRLFQKHQSWPRGRPCHTKAPKLAKRSPVSYKSTKVGPEVTSVIQKHQSWPRGRQCHMISNFAECQWVIFTYELACSESFAVTSVHTHTPLSPVCEWTGMVTWSLTHLSYFWDRSYKLYTQVDIHHCTIVTVAWYVCKENVPYNK